jgi:5-methylcytosine-specific restriction endonuclease McrA
MKACGRCKVFKSLDNFNKRSDRIDQYSSWCKQCQKDASGHRGSRKGYFDQRRRTQEHKDYQAKWQRENKSRLEAYRKKYALDNKERKRLYDIEYRKKNRNRLDTTIKIWHDAHPESRKVSFHNRRAREKSVGGKISKKEWRDLCIFYNNQCVSCGNNGKLTLDHVRPLVSGGENTIQNAQPLCKSCNSVKHTKTIDYRKVLPEWF